MTAPVPLDAARIIRKHLEHMAGTKGRETLFAQALDELASFAERFEPKALPGLRLETVVAGEQRELHIGGVKIGFDLIRLGDEVFVPETIEVDWIDGIASVTRKRDAEGGDVVISFEEPRQSWPLLQLIQARLMSDVGLEQTGDFAVDELALKLARGETESQQ